MSVFGPSDPDERCAGCDARINLCRCGFYPVDRPFDDRAPLSLGDALGLSLLSIEPEVAKATLRQVNSRSLASIIAALLEDEPLMRVEREGPSTLLVTVLGTGATLRVAVGQ